LLLNKNNYSSDQIIKPLDGLFEIHITIDPEGNYVKLLHFCQKIYKSTNLKIIYAVSEVKNNQLMISHFTKKDNDHDAIKKAKYLENQIREFNIKIIRVKVEAHNMKSFPFSMKDYKNYCEYIKKNYGDISGIPYFEFHLKIGHNTINENYLENLEKDISNFKGVAISYNICSNNCKPLLTIRVYDIGYEMAHKYKDYVIDKLKEKGYVFDEKIQIEFSIYDNNCNLDNGWLDCSLDKKLK
jgi:hypothetical protein